MSWLRKNGRAHRDDISRDLEEAAAAYDDLLDMLGSDQNPAIVERVAKGLVNKGGTLGRLRRIEEVLVANDAFESQPRALETPVSNECAARALLGRAWKLEQLNRPNEALSTYDRALARFDSGTASGSAENVARALLGKGALLEDLGSLDAALHTFDEIVSRFGTDETQGLVTTVASGLANAGAVLTKPGRNHEALDAFNSAVARCAGINTPDLLPVIEAALLNKALAECASGKAAKGVGTATRVLDREPGPEPRGRLRALCIRAFCHLEGGDKSLGESDIASALAMLPEWESYLPNCLDWLIRFTVPLGYARVLALIKTSPSADLLLPFATALKQEIGRDPKGGARNHGGCPGYPAPPSRPSR